MKLKELVLAAAFANWCKNKLAVTFAKHSAIALSSPTVNDRGYELHAAERSSLGGVKNQLEQAKCRD